MMIASGVTWCGNW